MTDRQDNIADDLNNFLNDLVSGVPNEPVPVVHPRELQPQPQDQQPQPQDQQPQPQDQQPQPQDQQPTDDELDKYMKKFDEVDKSNKKIATKVACIHRQADDQQRLYAAIECIKLLQAQLAMSHDLMVEMNNFFGKG